jgi:ketosteroid isomerase-like protein
MSSRRSVLLAGIGIVCAVSAAVVADTPEQALRARHQALTAAIARKDAKAAGSFYLPTYYSESKGEKHNRAESLKAMEQISHSAVQLRVKASLAQIVIKGDSATALETADITVVLPGQPPQKSPTQKTEQSWKLDHGTWKLAWEKSR